MSTFFVWDKCVCRPSKARPTPAQAGASLSRGRAPEPPRRRHPAPWYAQGERSVTAMLLPNAYQYRRNINEAFVRPIRRASAIGAVLVANLKHNLVADNDVCSGGPTSWDSQVGRSYMPQYREVQHCRSPDIVSSSRRCRATPPHPYKQRVLV